MSYTLRVRGLSISCGTLDELDALVEHYGCQPREPREEAEPARRTPAAPVAPTAPAAPAANVANGRHEGNQQRRGEADPLHPLRRRRGERTTVTGASGQRSFPQAVVLGVFADGHALTGAQAADRLGAVGGTERTRVSATVSSLARTGRIARAADGASYEITAIGRERLRRIDAALDAVDAVDHHDHDHDHDEDEAGEEEEEEEEEEELKEEEAWEGEEEDARYEAAAARTTAASGPKDP